MKRNLDNDERVRLRVAARKMDRVVNAHHDEFEQELLDLARFIGLELPVVDTHAKTERVRQ